ncbi:MULTISPECIES: TIGR03620 family F420-dependent LLM class oxidoreductase [Streptomyces]|uniref:TIGR03620 family F420-dependent LLM class oxidoreductase n=1 Tax=Streptomyces TaxID=1883 RepID=UPI0036827351
MVEQRRAGRVDAWLTLAGVSGDGLPAIAAEVERLGFARLWFPETPTSREAFTQAALLLAATERLGVATGIANVYARDATAAAAAGHTLELAFPGRFVMGLGTSHAVRNAERGHQHTKPLAYMASYLDSLDQTGRFDTGDARPPVVLAALRPRMQDLARERAAGVHTFFVTPDHTAAARTLLGDRPLLVPQQAFIITDDIDAAMPLGAAYVASRLALPNYVHHLQALGHTEVEVNGQATEKLVHEMVAIGGPDAVARRIEEHLAAGATRVAAHPLHAHDGGLAQLAALAEEIRP